MQGDPLARGSPPSDCRQRTLRTHNDRLRITGRPGIVLMTEHIAALGASAVNEVFRAVAAFTDFTPDNVHPPGR